MPTLATYVGNALAVEGGGFLFPREVPVEVPAELAAALGSAFEITTKEEGANLNDGA